MPESVGARMQFMSTKSKPNFAWYESHAIAMAYTVRRRGSRPIH
jgi:hypothetical protein